MSLRCWRDAIPKTPPIRFDRTPDGKIIIPGRWWQWMLETLSEMENVPPEVRRTAAVAARHVDAEDTLLPATTETIAIMAPNDRGEMVPHEALPPETLMVINVPAADEKG